VDGVAIPVTVKSGGKFVPGLKAADFEVRDNGVVQQIRTFDADAVPLDLTLLLDASTSVDGPLLQQLKFAVVDTAGLLHDNDRMRLVAVSQVLREVVPWRSRHESMPLDALAAEGGTSLYDALVAGMMRRAEPGRRQLVVAFTDGRDSTSILDEAETRQIARLTDSVVDFVIPITKDERSWIDRSPTRFVNRRSTRSSSPDRTWRTAHDGPAGVPTMKPWEIKDAGGGARRSGQSDDREGVHLRGGSIGGPSVSTGGGRLPRRIRTAIRTRGRAPGRLARDLSDGHTARQVRHPCAEGISKRQYN
jgi:hypothetical protein